jgi:hypothetical protein
MNMKGKAGLLLTVILVFSGVVNAQVQTPDQKQQEDFKDACAAGALKETDGCPQMHPQSDQGQQLVVPPVDHSLDHALDKPVPTFTIPKVDPPANSPPPPPTEPVVAPPPVAPAHTQSVVIPETRPLGQRQKTVDCGPATAPPGAGALYGVNRALCLRRKAKQQ